MQKTNMKNIVIVVDMQNGFSRYPQTKKLVQNIEQLLSENVFDEVICTRFLNAQNSMYEKMFDWHHLETEDERKLSDGIEKYATCIVDKYIYNCINASFIQKLCQLNNGGYPEQIYIVGADTDCCVLTIATSLFENNIRPVVLSKYCDSNGGPESHRAGIKCLERLIGKSQIVDREIHNRHDLLNG